MSCHIGEYHYTESGLANIYLEGVEICSCASCGETMTIIPAITDLHSKIGQILLSKKSLLTGKEIKYLRKNMGLTATRLAEILDVDNATISRWERGPDRKIDKGYDRLLRLVYATIKGFSVDDNRRIVEGAFPEIAPEIVEELPLMIPVETSRVENECRIS
ncbi:MAG: helix-turn-helix domain-containing protein [Deltaproteobacteria bacterium]|nr:helix-turn-helix domain-containing protein [Deltaproteobacteria bacterium]